MKNTELIEKLYENQNLEDCELLQLINTISEEEAFLLCKKGEGERIWK